MSNQNPLRVDGELALIEHIRQRFTRKQPGGRLSDGGLPELPTLMVGIGDDAAVLRVGGKNVLLTTDVMAEGVHFDMAFATPFQVGHKLVSVNVSDIYAMAGRPAYMLLTMSIPTGRMAEADGFIAGFFDGVESALTTYAVDLIGGDVTSSASGINLSATLIGFAQSLALRSGAVVGDKIYVTGNLGDSACGLHLLRRLNRPVAIERPETITETINVPLAWHVMEPLLRRHLMPVVSAPVGTERVSAMMDISDGLSIDLRRLCEHSGVGARVYEANLPQSPAMTEAAALLGLNPTMLALCGGEDYQYLFTSSESLSGYRCIGEITESEFVFIDTDNRQRELIRCGYEHFKN
ncbi:thiamine-phosphate kinase [Candidatus Magnetobacterium casense]|uniref:thiamine-phosphate kinase n=1 Tax=Candidatus Magnetobacterium casense TaxID=1455061 RepID=UPI000B286CF7|nr:thiamine-phosphate kinase [Candidatus Magnetobacterium casensis]